MTSLLFFSSFFSLISSHFPAAATATAVSCLSGNPGNKLHTQNKTEKRVFWPFWAKVTAYY